MMLHVLKHPDPKTLARCIEVADGSPALPGWELLSLTDFRAWEQQQIEAGWTPPVEPLPVPPVPESITNAQCRVVLIRQSINPDDVLSFINTAPMPSEQVRREIKARWEYSNHIYRRDPATIQLGNILGFTSAQMDDLFRAASLIP
jgi:hypothetical protein